MSFYSDASLVLIPSGYKNQKIYAAKPTDGSADLVFSRASNATRVASNGLIEKVRTNLILQSNTFSTTWFNINSTETSGQAGYDGTNNAWRIDLTGAAGYISQSISNSGVATASIYAKAGTLNFVRVRVTGSGFDKLVDVDLTDGSIDTTGAGNINATATSVGSGWYKITLTFDSSTSALLIYPIQAANDFTATSGNILIQNAQLEQGDVATDYIATTTTAVSVGPVSGLPRLDYLNSSCPRLLLEGQRTNLFPYYSYLSGWSVNSVTLANNYATSPEGLQNATRLTRVTTGNIGQNVAITSGTNYAISIFGKADTGSIVNITTTGDFPSSTLEFDLSDQSTSVTLGSFVSYGIESYGNGWYRCWLVQAPTTTGTGTIRINTGDNMSVLLYGAQCEAGSYMTSLIPTNGTSVTRVADAASKTGISSLIGQTEGTLFVEVDSKVALQLELNGTQRALMVSDGTNTNRILMNFFRNSSGVTQIESNLIKSTSQASFASVITENKTYKIAFAYKANDFVFYINGVQIGTDTSGDTFSAGTLSRLDVGQDFAGTLQQSNPISQALLFTTRLTNAQLAELTA
jgi:hypothetical protein